MVFFVLRETLADLGSLYLMILGAVAIVDHAARAARRLGLSCAAATRSNSFPLTRRVVPRKPN